MQVVGEAALRVSAITRDLRRVLQRSVSDSLRDLQVPANNALTTLQRDLRRGELQLAAAREQAADAQDRVVATERELLDLRRSGKATAEQLTAAERRHRVALIDLELSTDRIHAAEERRLDLQRRLRAAMENTTVETERSRRSLSSLLGALEAVASGAGDVAAKGAGIALVGTAAAGAVAGVGALTGAVAALVAALGQGAAAAGILPAALVGVRAVVATVKLGLEGMDDALKAVAEGDAEKLKEALKELSPEARAFVLELARIKPEFDGMRLGVQERLFAGLSDRLAELAERYLPQGIELFEGLADTINQAGHDVIDFALSGAALRDTSAIADLLQRSFGNLRQAAAPAARAVLDVVRTGSTFLPRLTESLADWATKWSERISEMSESGELEAIFQRALDVLAQFGRVLGNVGDMIAGVFRAADDAGGGLLDTLEKVTGKAAEFVNSGRGQTALGQFFSSVSDIAEALTPVLFEVVELIGELSPVAADLAETVGPIFTRALQKLGPHLVDLAGFFVDLVAAAEPLIDVLVDLLAEALEAIAPILPEIVAAFGRFIDVLSDMLSGGLGEMLIEVFRSLVELLPVMLDLLTALLPILEPILILLAGMVKVLATVIKGVATLVESVANELSGNGFVASLVEATKRLENEGGSAYGRFVAGVRAGTQQIVNDMTWGRGEIGNTVRGIAAHWDWYNGTTLQKQELARVYLNRYVAAINDAFAGRHSAALRRGGAQYQQLSNSARQALADAREALRRYVLQVSTIFEPSGMFSRAFRGGRSLGDGFAQGIRSQVGAAASAANALVGAAGSFLPRSPAARGPFSGRGWVTYRGASIAEGLAAGMRAFMPVVAEAAAQLAEAASLGLPAGPTELDLSRGLRTALAPVEPPAPVVEPPATAEDLAAAVAGAVGGLQVVISDRDVTSAVALRQRRDARR